MWGADKRKKLDINQYSGKTTIIALDADFQGNIQFTGALQIDGRVEGNIVADKGLVRVSEHGIVEGTIKAPSVLINGQVVGDVEASEHLELDSKARIQGDLHYRFMEMVMGAQISGALHYLDDAAPTLPGIDAESDNDNS
ncbi:bactofilin family protein [Halopseudomonas salegens]|uniref:Protein CcmA, bactofilin family n=1 Tax=Halopseudomonas salegens TaxID=1434072 RepID=A0A1H2DZL1_9GAMM|nr:polymer-forming cytoskeletal protein [Halopseudomonas salegens]SDT88312.1 protein CcmA, bactofilin family [Halopseudomonas salegens]